MTIGTCVCEEEEAVEASDGVAIAVRFELIDDDVAYDVLLTPLLECCKLPIFVLILLARLLVMLLLLLLRVLLPLLILCEGG